MLKINSDEQNSCCTTSVISTCLDCFLQGVVWRGSSECTLRSLHRRDRFHYTQGTVCKRVTVIAINEYLKKNNFALCLLLSMKLRSSSLGFKKCYFKYRKFAGRYLFFGRYTYCAQPTVFTLPLPTWYLFSIWPVLRVLVGPLSSILLFLEVVTKLYRYGICSTPASVVCHGFLLSRGRMHSERWRGGLWPSCSPACQYILSWLLVVQRENAQREMERRIVA